MLDEYDLSSVSIINDGSLYTISENIKSKIYSLYDNNLADILSKLSKEELYILVFFDEFWEGDNKIILASWKYDEIMRSLRIKRKHQDKKESRESNFEDLFLRSSVIDIQTNIKEDLIFIKKINELINRDEKNGKFLILTNNEKIVDNKKVFSISKFCEELKKVPDFMKIIKDKYTIEPNNP